MQLRALLRVTSPVHKLVKSAICLGGGGGYICLRCHEINGVNQQPFYFQGRGKANFLFVNHLNHDYGIYTVHMSI